MSKDQICKWCDTWYGDHSRDHLAETCFPAQIDASHAENERLRAALAACAADFMSNPE